MSDKELGFWGYCKAAFHLKPYVKGLGSLPLNKILLAGFAILGIGNYGFWFVGAALEIAYLLFIPSNPHFQKFIDATQRLRIAQPDWTRKIGLLFSNLESESQTRYRKLELKCSEILRYGEGLPDPDHSLTDVKSAGVNKLLWIFLQMLNSRQALARNLRSTDRQQVLEEIRQLEVELKRGEIPEAVQKAKNDILELKKKRLENLEKANETMQTVEAELLRIEEQVELLREEAAVKHDPQSLSGQLDAVTGTLSDTISWIDRQDELFRSLEDPNQEPPPPLIRQTQ